MNEYIVREEREKEMMNHFNEVDVILRKHMSLNK
jgi:hypothetical protein